MKNYIYLVQTIDLFLRIKLYGAFSSNSKAKKYVARLNSASDFLGYVALDISIKKMEIDKI